ncbi:carboxypeptidase regulatory-like domain-containing protein [Promicromonospora xylanilytica]
MKHSRAGLGVLVAAVLVALCAALAAPATARAGVGWAEWEPLAGSAGDWSTTVRLPAAGFPAATVTSDARGGVGVASGVSSWLGAATPPGEVFGSSKGSQYLVLRPLADRPGAPSVTTYTFDHPTPAGGWAFVLGDIDADRAVVTARGPDGLPLGATQLGWQGGFNYCTGPGSPRCAGLAQDAPAWDPATGELARDASAADTSGAAGWFRPTAPVTSLTVELHRRSGFPVSRMWFASLARDIAGTVELVGATGAVQGVLPGARLRLLGPDGARLGTATSDESGQYVFPGYVAAPGYRVELTSLRRADDAYPAGLVPVSGRAVVVVDLGAGDATGVDLAAREVRPVAVRGTVLTDGGAPVPGATVTLTPTGGGAPLTAVTTSAGEYLIDGVGWGTGGGRAQGYTFALSDLPEGHTTTVVPDGITVAAGQEEAVEGNDFVVGAAPSVSGRVAAGGDPVAGARLTLEGEGGTVGTTTAADGTYVFDAAPSGEHAVRVSPPGGYQVTGPAARRVTVGTKGLAGVDFALSRTGAVGGTVTDGAGGAVAGATVTVAGLGGQLTVATDAVGGYFVDGLAPGEYLVTLTVPDGYTADAVERSVAVTRAGERRLDESFRVAEVLAPSTSPVPSGTPATAPSVVSTPSRTPEPSAGPPPGVGPGGTSTGGGPAGLAATGATVGVVGLAAAILLALGNALVRGSRTADPADGDG